MSVSNGRAEKSDVQPLRIHFSRSDKTAISSKIVISTLLCDIFESWRGDLFPRYF